jgi:hypothetical protein
VFIRLYNTSKTCYDIYKLRIPIEENEMTNQEQREQMTFSELITRANREMQVAYMFYENPPVGHPCPQAVGDWWARQATYSFEAAYS